MIFNLVSHCVMRVESDSRKKRDVHRPPETLPPAEDQRRLEFQLLIIKQEQIIIITVITNMLHRRPGFTTISIIRREFHITRRQITNTHTLMTSEMLIMTSRPIRSCLGGLTSRTGPALSTILRCDE